MIAAGGGATAVGEADRRLVAAILDAVEPAGLVERALRGERPPPSAVVALGKAAAALARGAAAALAVPADPPPGGNPSRRPGAAGEAPTGFRGLVLRPASSAPLFPGGGPGSPAHPRPRTGSRDAPWEEHTGGHPLPDVDSLGAGHALAGLLRALGPEDHLLALVSGGGSACCELPAGTLSIADLAATGRALLASGLPIDRVNGVRKHLSRLKGGGALRTTAARVTALVLSDVPSDDPSVVASGPFAPDPTTYADALAAVEGLAEGEDGEGLPRAVLRHLRSGAAGGEAETLKPGDPAAARAGHRLLAGHRTAAAAAARWLEERGYRVERGDLSGEAAGAGRKLVRRGRALEGEGPVALVLSGETTVTLDPAPPRDPVGREGAGARRPEGRGGRNQELALAAAAELAREQDRGTGGAGAQGERVLALATDGADGPTPAAGAVVDRATWRRLEDLGAEPARALRRHASHDALARLEGCLLRTGPTGTNVADVAVYLRGRPPADHP